MSRAAKAKGRSGQNEIRDTLLETFPEFVKWKTQNGKISISINKNLSGFKMIKCYYNKAAKYSNVSRLNYE